jgi:hypothetical protein
MKKTNLCPISHRFKVLAIAAAGTLLLNTASVCVADTLNPLADTYVQSLVTTDFSAGTQLLVKNQFGGSNPNNRITFLRFDGTGLGGANAVSGAALNFTISSFSTPVNMTLQLFGIPDGAANENFDASTITYANSGYTDGSADNNVNDTLLGSPLATFALPNTATAGTQISFSGAGLDAFLSANANSDVAFLLTTTTQNSSVFLGFASSENTTYAVPTLTYSVTPVPEPSGFSLALIGGLGLLAASRRRA